MSLTLKEQIELEEENLRNKEAKDQALRFVSLRKRISEAAARSRVKNEASSVGFSAHDFDHQEIKDIVKELKSLDLFVKVSQNGCYSPTFFIEPMSLHNKKEALKQKNETNYCLLLYCGGSTSIGVALAGTSHHEAMSSAAAAAAGTNEDSAGVVNTDGC